MEAGLSYVVKILLIFKKILNAQVHRPIIVGQEIEHDRE